MKSNYCEIHAHFFIFLNFISIFFFFSSIILIFILSFPFRRWANSYICVCVHILLHSFFIYYFLRRWAAFATMWHVGCWNIHRDVIFDFVIDVLYFYRCFAVEFTHFLSFSFLFGHLLLLFKQIELIYLNFNMKRQHSLIFDNIFNFWLNISHTSKHILDQIERNKLWKIAVAIAVF